MDNSSRIKSIMFHVIQLWLRHVQAFALSFKTNVSSSKETAKISEILNLSSSCKKLNPLSSSRIFHLLATCIAFTTVEAVIDQINCQNQREKLVKLMNSHETSSTLILTY
ncbi:CLUMA_CG011010, isoform A [Clunio marinus]|uniref:CLUMA_CG011010, isoform A n=1 Tax=Clunio marinus TaxID=568069 RepID=A0A1J1IBK9_9DIPT|nr:CLUMA_CG011010, isoform A [Clunio marinus]